MTNLYLIEKTNVIDEAKLYSFLSDPLNKRVSETKSENRRLERLISYSFISFLIKSAYPCDEKCELAFDTEGKPFLKNSPLKVSISHSDGLIVIGVCDGDICGFGVDIEKVNEKSNETAEKFLKKYGIGDILASECSASVFLALLDKDDVFKIAKKSEYSPKKSFDPIDNWTRLESLLKAEGKGFCALKNLPGINAVSSVSTFDVKKEDLRYSLSFAII